MPGCPHRHRNSEPFTLSHDSLIKNPMHFHHLLNTNGGAKRLTSKMNFARALSIQQLLNG